MLYVYEGGVKTIAIDGRWLYPLFLLHLANRDSGNAMFPRDQQISVRDPLIGRAAVFLYHAIGIGRAEGEIVSDLAWSTAAALGIEVTRTESVPSLACATENLFAETIDCGEALRILDERLSPNFYTDPGSFVSVEVASDTRATQVVTQYLETRAMHRVGGQVQSIRQGEV